MVLKKIMLEDYLRLFLCWRIRSFQIDMLKENTIDVNLKCI